MNLVELVEVDVWAKLDELVLSRFCYQDIDVHDVVNMIINHASIAVGEKILIKLCLMGYCCLLVPSRIAV